MTREEQEQQVIACRKAARILYERFLKDADTNAALQFLIIEAIEQGEKGGKVNASELYQEAWMTCASWIIIKSQMNKLI